MPSISGIFQSMSTNSKGTSLPAVSSSVIPSGPEAATETSNEKDSSIILQDVP